MTIDRGHWNASQWNVSIASNLCKFDCKWMEPTSLYFDHLRVGSLERFSIKRHSIKKVDKAYVFQTPIICAWNVICAMLSILQQLFAFFNQKLIFNIISSLHASLTLPVTVHMQSIRTQTFFAKKNYNKLLILGSWKSEEKFSTGPKELFMKRYIYALEDHWIWFLVFKETSYAVFVMSKIQ